MEKTDSNIAEVIRDLIKATRALPLGNEEKLDLLQKRVKMVIRRTFGNSHEYRQDLDEIAFPPSHLSQTDEYLDDWLFGEARMLNLLEVMLAEVDTFGVPNKDGSGVATSKLSNRVFVAHGHDEGMREATARTLEKVGLKPIIMGEQTSEGRTVAEQLEHYSDVLYAVILLSPDDMDYPRGSDPSEARPRARQNVVDELGFFKCRLGRSNIFILYREEKDFEAPSNIAGVLYVPYDESGHWKIRLVREIHNRGLEVRLDNLIPDYPAALTKS